MSTFDNNPNYLNRVIPTDEHEKPVAVQYAQLPDGSFVPVAYDAEGRLYVVTNLFIDSNGNPSSARVSPQGRVQTDVVSPLPSGTNIIGRTAPASNTPIYAYMHRNITEPETDTPTSPIGFDFTGYREMVVDVKLTGVGAYITLVPLVWNPINEVYQVGESRRFTRNDRAVIEVYGADDVYLLPVEVSGIVSVVVAGV